MQRNLMQQAMTLLGAAQRLLQCGEISPEGVAILRWSGYCRAAKQKTIRME